MNPSSEWAPLPQRNKSSSKRIRETQAKLVNQLREMFGDTFEPEIIASVAENCKWKLDPSIDALINMSQMAQNSKPKPPVYDPWEDNDFSNHEPQHDFTPDTDFSSNDADLLKLDDDELAQQQEEMRKFEHSKKIETASLCGLKVQYRPKGMENNSDDDADVVIEEESCDYRVDTPEPECAVNVCQFLSSPTQHPPKNTLPKTECVNTPSPPRSPRRSKPLSALQKIESDIEKGYKILVLMRGASGSGKSYLAKDLVKRTVEGDLSNHIFSTDDYFSKINRGVYTFDASKLSDAHIYNQNCVLNAMRQGWSPVIVDNTNTQVWEMEHYAVNAVKFGYIVETLEPNTPWSRKASQLESKNRHGVQKQTIQKMLDRYEPNISGEKLLRILKLRYKPEQEPPQMRKQPPLQPELENKLRELNISEDVGVALENSATSSPKLQRRPRMPKASQPQAVSQKQEETQPPQQEMEKEEKPQLLDQLSDSPPQRLIDNEALNTIAKEYANFETTTCTATNPTNRSNSTSGSDNKQRVNESWTEGTSYKEDSFLDLRLGAIGSERRTVEAAVEVDDFKEDSGADEGDKSSGLQGMAPDRANGEGAFSPCWDFTLLLGDTRIHSKSDDEGQVLEIRDQEGPVDSANSVEESEAQKPVTETTETTKSNEIFEDSCNVTNAPPTESIEKRSNIEREDSPETDSEISQTPLHSKSSELEGFATEIFSSEPSTRSSNSSLEKVDVSQCDVGGNTENSSSQLVPCEPKSEEQTSGGLGSLFSFIKNSFLGNEKDSTAKLPKLENCDQPNPPLDQSICDKSEFVVTPEVPLSPVISPSREPPGDIVRNLNLEALRGDENDQADVSLENEEFFEASDAIAGQTRDVEELLREASSDFPLVEQLDFTERKMDNAMAEKTFTEQKKNLQVLDAFEDDENKVSKEPIDRVFGSKNVFPEKIQNDISNVDNVNLISWRESPFPSIPLDNVAVDTELPVGRVVTRDIETFTDPYDFNVAYIGGTDDYKILHPVSRNINDSNRHIQNDLESTPTRKLMLHKGTMTPARTSLLHLVDDPKIISSLENENDGDDDDDDELEEQKRLVEEESRRELLCKFGHMIPRSCVLHVYEQLCAKDADWTSDYLYNLMDNDDASLHAALDQLEAEASIAAAAGACESESGDGDCASGTPEDQDASDKCASTLTTSSSSSPALSEDRQQQQQRTTPTTPTTTRSSRRDKSRHQRAASAERIALKQQLEGMFVLSEDSYPKHTLRVRRWKNRDFSKDRSAAATAAAVESATEMMGDLMSFEEQQQQQHFYQEALPTTDFIPNYSMGMDESWSLYNPDQQQQPPQPEEEISDFDDEEEETMDLTLGHEFIRVLESNFGSQNFETPTGLFPVIKIRRSMAQELYTLWVESMQRQLWSMQEELDASIAKDAEYARSLEKEEEAIIREPEVPNLREIMDMELALANACNDFKHKYRKETPKDLTFRVTKKSLHDLFPDCSADTLFEIYESHDRNFEETIKVIKENCGGSPITMADVLKKRKNLIDELQKESSYQTSKHNQLRSDAGFNEACGGDMYEQFNQEPELNEEEAMRAARDSRMEARRQLELRNENYLKANEARRRKALDVAEYYSEMAKLHMRNMETANHAAASALITAQTHTNNKIDLHFFLVSEALQALDMFLDRQIGSLPKNGKKQVYIITGRGARSSNGRSKIKPAVAQKLNQRNIRFCEENPGMLKAYLRNK